MRKKILFSLSSVFLALIVAASCILCYNQKERYSTEAQVRTVAVSNEEIDYESILNDFEDGKIEKEGSLTTFEGYKPLKLADFTELENLSEANLTEEAEIKVKYNFSYDYETNLVTLSAQSVSETGEIEVDEISGYAFQNSVGEMDALLEVDGEYILLSEMQDSGLIQNCGWFKRLFKKVVVAVVAVVAVAAVAAAVVATCGAGLGACIAAGAVAGAVAGGVAGGIISYSEYGKLDWRWIAGGVVIGDRKSVV